MDRVRDMEVTNKYRKRDRKFLGRDLETEQQSRARIDFIGQKVVFSFQLELANQSKVICRTGRA